MEEELNINDYLFDELLIEIFTYLSTRRRLQSQRVCNRWLYILRSSPKFTEDRHLYFSNCVLDDKIYPGTLFIDSGVSYKSLTFGINCYLTRNCNDLCERFEKVSRLDISRAQGYRFPVEYAMMLSELKNLKELCAENQDSCLNLQAAHWKTVDISKVLASLEELRLEHLNCQRLDAVIGVLEMCPKVTRLFLGKIYNMRVDKFVEFLLKYENIIKGLSINWDEIHAESLQRKLMENFHSLQHLTLEEFGFTSVNCQYDLLYQMCLTQPRLSLIDFCCTNYVTRFGDKITSLAIKFQRCITSFESFTPFSNLTKLTVRLSYNHPDGCFFGHEVIRNEKLKKFSLSFAYGGKACQLCYKMMALSYPNLESLEVSGDGIDTYILKIVTRNMVKLKKLSIRNFEAITSLQEALRGLVVHERIPLKILTLENLTEFSKNDVQILAQKCPMLQNLSITMFREYPKKKVCELEKILFETLKNYPKLQKLTLEAFGHEIDHPSSDLLIEEIVKLGRNLKVLSVPFVRIPNEKTFYLFEQLPCLYRVLSDFRNVSRKDYHEIKVQKTKTIEQFMKRPDQGGWMRFAVTSLSN